ncbi:unnamed protein product [Durusdinium trenchii]|uniref:RING-CH-type domain-containing protein n=1 Tax=Durusdinium trenchii TaxID=1381693 RepID=A0ABP0JJL6_9DINO
MLASRWAISSRWAIGVGFGSFLLQQTPTSAEWRVAILLLGAAGIFGALLVTYGAMYLRPSSFHSLKLLEKGSRDACRYFAVSIALLGSFQFLLVALRLWPELLLVATLHELPADLVDAFPEGLELNLTNGVLSGGSLSSSHEPRLSLELPSLSLFDLCGGSLSWTLLSLDFGSPDLRNLGKMLVAYFYWSRTGQLQVPSFNSQVLQFELDEPVEVLLDQDLVACGAPRPLLPQPLMGTWLPATVRGVQPSTMLAQYKYQVYVGGSSDNAEELPACNGTEPLAACVCSVLPTALRRTSRLLIDLEEAPSLEELQASKAILALGSRSFAILEGFSFHHNQYWSHRRSSGQQLWRSYSKKELRLYEPLQCMTGLYCRKHGNSLLCSRQEAQAQIGDWEQQWPSLFWALRWKLVLPLGMLLGWMACILASFITQGSLVLLFYWPLGYFAYAFLRHVDAPVPSIGRSLVVAIYTGMPFMVLHSMLEIVWHMWGDGDLLPSYLEEVIDLELNREFIFYVWLLWSSYLVNRLRFLAAQQRKAPPRLHPQRAEGQEASEAPTCRICFGGSESGRLISPCLCSGSMRYVHMDCLNMWRASSANPQSSFRCDQCQYVYSVQRAFYANILRSALVLHTVTLLVFGLVVLLCAYICLFMDWLQNGSTPESRQLFSESLMEQLTNVTGLEEAFRSATCETRFPCARVCASWVSSVEGEVLLEKECVSEVA